MEETIEVAEVVEEEEIGIIREKRDHIHNKIGINKNLITSKKESIRKKKVSIKNKRNTRNTKNIRNTKIIRNTKNTGIRTQE